MSGNVEIGKCDCCGKDGTLSRKYYYYDVKCECCNGDTHFEIIKHCASCIPRPPENIKIVLEGYESFIQEEHIQPCGCSSTGDPIKWNPYNKVVQCHKCGSQYSLKPSPVTTKEDKQ
jgi:hypothetical protein